jgi:hypothetical protein
VIIIHPEAAAMASRSRLVQMLDGNLMLDNAKSGKSRSGYVRGMLGNNVVSRK